MSRREMPGPGRKKAQSKALEYLGVFLRGLRISTTNQSRPSD
jgi:hypothetical protein